MRISDWSSDVCSSDLQHAQTGHPAYRANLSVQPCKGNRMASETSLNADIEDGVRRRDFINIAAVSFAGVGAATVVLPLVNQMNPSADVLALSSTEIDISAIQPGQAIKTSWRKQPVFVRNLVPAEIEAAKKVPLSDLRDPQTIDERTKPGKENWLITHGVCTHPGCVPLGAAGAQPRGDYGGYFCPRSEERRYGQECVITWRSRCAH